MRQSDKGKAVEYDGLVDKLINGVFPDHFSLVVDDDARKRILNVSGVYSKAKVSTSREWVEDSEKKDKGSTPEIRDASKIFLSDSYSELRKHSIV